MTQIAQSDPHDWHLDVFFHTKWECYLEMMYVLKDNAHVVTERVRDVILAWFPQMMTSVHIEYVFKNLTKLQTDSHAAA
eukprot:6861603-Karenia_brevis.AAC.1